MGEPFVSGTLAEGGQHQIGVNLLRSRLSEGKAHMFCRFVENWCAQECMGLWRVEQSPRALLISFEDSRDMVLFRMTPEWDFLRDNAQVGDIE